MNNYQIDRLKWAKLTTFEQLGNIGAEVGRTLAARRDGDIKRMDAAFYRGLDLIDATAKIWAKDKKPGLKELLRTRELFAEAITDDTDANWLEDYFMQFAMAARLNK